MNGEDIQQCARERVDELPGSELTHPFGPEPDAYKVRGKVFMLLSLDADGPLMTLKVRPEEGEALRAGYAEITPGYHMNKKHWITVRPGGGLDAGLIADLVTDSYLLVIETLPRRLWPVDPATFGRRDEHG